MEAVDTRRIGLAPDVCELLAGGADPLRVVRDLLPTIRHVHLKDVNGGASNDGFCPLGEGRVDLAAIVDVLEGSTNDFIMMVELNPASGNVARTPLDTARTRRAFLERLGYAFRT